MAAHMLCLPGLARTDGEGPPQVVLERRAVAAEHEHVGRDAVVVAEGRVRACRRGGCSGAGSCAAASPRCVGPETLRTRPAREEQLDVPGQVPGQGVHQERGDRVLLQPVPQPAERVARQLPAPAPARSSGSRVIAEHRRPCRRRRWPCGPRRSWPARRAGRPAGRRPHGSSSSSLVDEVARLRLDPAVQPQQQRRRTGL